MKNPPAEVIKKHIEVCDKCPRRKFAAKILDMHFDWLDCWYACPNDYENWLKGEGKWRTVTNAQSIMVVSGSKTEVGPVPGLNKSR